MPNIILSQGKFIFKVSKSDDGDLSPYVYGSKLTDNGDGFGIFVVIQILFRAKTLSVWKSIA